jgi:putative hemolysin
MSMVRVVLMLVVATAMAMTSCASPQEHIRNFQKELARRAAEPRTPEEYCQRRGGVMRGEQCYAPSATTLDERSCRLRGGLYLDDHCLVSEQGRGPKVMMQ